MILTGGLLWLFFYWIPRHKLKLTHEIVTLAEADTVLVQVRVSINDVMIKRGQGLRLKIIEVYSNLEMCVPPKKLR